MIEQPFGRSVPEMNLLRVAADGKIAMFQSYTDVKSVVPSTGSVAPTMNKVVPMTQHTNQ